jgi:hypothetical protein
MEKDWVLQDHLGCFERLLRWLETLDFWSKETSSLVTVSGVVETLSCRFL